MKKPVISLDVATEEVTHWLDTKKVSAKKRDEYSSQIEEIAQGLSDGLLTLDKETNEFTQTLKIPIGEKGSESITTLKYKSRVKMEVIRVQMANTKPNDLIGMQIAYVAAITGESRGILKEMDSGDWSLASAIQVFFI